MKYGVVIIGCGGEGTAAGVELANLVESGARLGGIGFLGRGNFAQELLVFAVEEEGFEDEALCFLGKGAVIRAGEFAEAAEGLECRVEALEGFAFAVEEGRGRGRLGIAEEVVFLEENFAGVFAGLGVLLEGFLGGHGVRGPEAAGWG